MNRPANYLLCLASLLILSAVLTVSVRAEDEDMTSSVYLVFDAETGEFVEVDDPNRVQQTHDAADPAAGPVVASLPGGLSVPATLGVVAMVLAIIFGAGYLYKKRASGPGKD